MSSFMRRGELLVVVGVAVLVVTARSTPSGSIVLGGSSLTSYPVTVVPLTSSRVVGAPSLSAAFMNRVLATYHSPAAGLGQALYADGVRFHLDSAFALAFFLEESAFGTTGVARVTHSLGNIICTPGYPTCYAGFRWYPRWEDGACDWFRLIATEYVPRGLTTVETIVPVYAPSSDANDVAAYISTVKQAVATWRAGRVWV